MTRKRDRTLADDISDAAARHEDFFNEAAEAARAKGEIEAMDEADRRRREVRRRESERRRRR
jgi:hypothetical protein